MSYTKINNLAGWTVFAIALLVYLMTMEPTSSFWDCGEFLACAARLEVGHAPGAPFFMLLQRFFALFAAGNPQRIALFINAESALASAFTILFLFWTITRMANRILTQTDTAGGKHNTLLSIGAGATGALAYTFSDTFWFSAVEAEVYATSSLFTALVFWAMLRWEAIADRPKADRWLLLIAYLIGLSIGIHLLNLLTIPALAVIYYFRRCRFSKTGLLLAFCIGCGLLGLVQFGIIQFLPALAARFELVFVNDFGLPYDSGALFFILLLAGLLIRTLSYARRKNRYLLHTGTLGICFVLLGFSTYTVTLLRSRAEVGVDMTNPDNIHSLVAYLQRTQYLQQPLISGPDYNSPVTGLKKKGDIYSKTPMAGKDHYRIIDTRLQYKYDPSRIRFFPRIWDNSDPNKVRFYQDFLGYNESDIPTSADNLSFFMGYQINWMWFRYFMWNYAGRQNDLEGQGDAKRGNWISGIDLLDKSRVGATDLMGSSHRNNPAHNKLYCLPLVLGLAGLWYQFRHRRKDALACLLLFFFTGIAIGIYLNMSALQPRERDYAFAGSTYAFAIWIGLGVLALQFLMQRLLKRAVTPAWSICCCLLAAPVLMAAEEWDDHDRSVKTLARDTAFNVLQSCAPNAILFTQADNDTYPLWYLQEVEGIRQDVRVIITELAGADWYIDQLNRKINQADAVPMIWKPGDYMGGKHNYISYVADPRIPKDKYLELGDVCRFMITGDSNYKLAANDGALHNFLPSKNLFIRGLSPQQLLERKLLTDTAGLDNSMKWTLPKDILYKNDLALLNIIAAVAEQGWQRPVYFSGALIGSSNVLNLGPYLHMEGVAYRLLPFTRHSAVQTEERNPINLDKSLALFTQTYLWGGADHKQVYFDEKNRIMLMPYRIYGSQLVLELMAQNRTEEATALLDTILKKIPETAYPYDISGYYLAEALYSTGQNPRGRNLVTGMARDLEADLGWINSLTDRQQQGLIPDVRQDIGILQMLMNLCRQYKDETTARQLEQQLQRLLPMANRIVDRSGA